ncbi:hypothetical protein PFISCL1PPCAC_21494, partial [Pristionchus fissidentatus]
MGVAAEAAAAAPVASSNKKTLSVRLLREVENDDPTNQRRAFIEVQSRPVIMHAQEPVRSGMMKSQPGASRNPDQPGPSSPKRIKVEEEEEEIDGSNHMENLLNFAEDCEKAVKYADEV